MNDYGFTSGFADKLSKFVEQKRALGIGYVSTVWLLREFDKTCAERFPEADCLTQEIFYVVAVKKDTENGTTFRNRISPVREFAKFLVRNGESAYVLPTDLAKKSPRHLPYIYSKEEIAAIWDEYDNLNRIPYLPTRHLVLPAIMRVLYCCGLRPIEVC